MSSNDEFEELRDDFQQKEARRQRRIMEKKWAKILPISQTINCRWLAPIVKGEEAEVEVNISGVVLHHSVGQQVRLDQDGHWGQHLDIKRYGYKGAVEKWALWKWHTARGTPVDERDNYFTEPGYEAPTFVWEPEPVAEPVVETAKRGRPAKVSAANA